MNQPLQAASHSLLDHAFHEGGILLVLAVAMLMLALLVTGYIGGLWWRKEHVSDLSHHNQLLKEQKSLAAETAKELSDETLALREKEKELLYLYEKATTTKEKNALAAVIFLSHWNLYRAHIALLQQAVRTYQTALIDRQDGLQLGVTDATLRRFIIEAFRAYMKIERRLNSMGLDIDADAAASGIVRETVPEFIEAGLPDYWHEAMRSVTKNLDEFFEAVDELIRKEKLGRIYEAKKIRK